VAGLPRLARVSVTEYTGNHFLADITEDRGSVVVTIDAVDDDTCGAICQVMDLEGAEYEVAYDVPEVYAVVCFALQGISPTETAEQIHRLFGNMYEKLVTTYWYDVAGGKTADDQLGAVIGPAPQSVTFGLADCGMRHMRELWRQFDDRINDRYADWTTSISSNDDGVEIDFTPERFAVLEETLLELAGLFSFNR